MSYLVYNGKRVVSSTGKYVGASSVTPPVSEDLILTFDDIGNVPVGDPTSVSDWNTWFDLPSNGSQFTSASVDGNEVTLSGGSGITLKPYLFGDDDCGPALLSIVDSGAITAIGEGVFSGCYNLTTASFPSITSTGTGAFEDCYALTDFIISDTVTSIGDYTFENCESLTSISIPANVTNIGELAFNNCTSLTEINVSSSNSNYASIDGVLFSKDELTLIVYPKGKLDESYAIPDDVTTIKAYAFYSNQMISTVTMPNSVTTMEECTFNQCSNLTDINLSTSLTSLEPYVFASSGLTSITLPSNVSQINSYAFLNCASLSVVNSYPLAAPSTTNDPFPLSMGGTLHIQSSGTSGYNVSPWTNTNIFTSIIQDL